MRREMEAKDVKGDGGKVCRGRWEQRVQREMGAKDAEGDGGKECGWSENGLWLYRIIKNTILHGDKDGDFYPEFLPHKNLDNIHKNVRKRYKLFKPKLLSALVQGRIIIVQIWLSLCLIDCDRFTRHYHGKLYSRHLFS